VRIFTGMMLATLGIAIAQSPQTPFPQNTPGVSPPTVIDRHEPQYTDVARQARLNGSVELTMVVDETGGPRDFRVTRSLGLGLDEEAIKAVRTWRFRPGTKAGQPVPVIATVQINFRIAPPPGDPWHLEGASLDTPRGVFGPWLLKCEFPTDRPKEDTKIVLSFDVSETGVPVNLSVADPGSSALEPAVIEAIEQWRFTPARNNGFAIPVHATFTFVANRVAGAPATPSPPPPRVVAGITQPRLLSSVEAIYSEEAQKANLHGIVMIDATIGTSGVTSDFKITQSLGLGLDEAALRAVRQWRYSPALKDGVPVDFVVHIQVSFRLPGDHAGWYLSRAAFDAPEDVQRPVLSHADYPHETPKERAHVSISFDINEHGEPKNLNVDKSVDSKTEQDIIAAVKKWRFKPAMKNGAAIAVRATFEFVASPWSPRA
jgi:TonB family protein